MCEKNSPSVFKYTDWITTLTSFLQKNLCHLRHPESMDEEVELRRFVDVCNMDLFLTTLNFFNDELNKNTFNKIFIQNTNLVHREERRKSNNINLNQVLDHCNSLIVPYRSNVLLTYISDKKAYENKIYYIDYNGANAHQLGISKDFKTEWNKEDYLDTLEHLTYTNDNVFKKYKDFDGPKCIVNFENLHRQKDKISYVQELYDKNKINVTIDRQKFNPTVKQSKKQPLEDNFTNPEEFLNDLPSIQTHFNYQY